MVTSAMLRTWPVRLPAIGLTLSVRSFQTPLTSRTCAWPPSLPSVPTSRATRVTSEVNTPSCSIIVLTMVAERRNSPSSGRPSTSSAHGLPQVALGHGGQRARDLGRRPQQVVDQRVDRGFHLAPGADRPPELHALPRLALLADDRARRVRVRAAMRWRSTRRCSLKASAILPSMPVQSPGRRTEKSPCCTACRARSSSESCEGGGGATSTDAERSTARATRHGYLRRGDRGGAHVFRSCMARLGIRD